MRQVIKRQHLQIPFLQGHNNPVPFVTTRLKERPANLISDHTIKVWSDDVVFAPPIFGFQSLSWDSEIKFSHPEAGRCSFQKWRTRITFGMCQEYLIEWAFLSATRNLEEEPWFQFFLHVDFHNAKNISSFGEATHTAPHDQKGRSPKALPSPSSISRILIH